MECQRLQAATAGLTVADLPAWGLATEYVNASAAAEWPATTKKHGSWHLNTHGFRAVAAAIAEALSVQGG